MEELTKTELLVMKSIWEMGDWKDTSGNRELYQCTFR